MGEVNLEVSKSLINADRLDVKQYFVFFFRKEDDKYSSLSMLENPEESLSRETTLREKWPSFPLERNFIVKNRPVLTNCARTIASHKTHIFARVIVQFKSLAGKVSQQWSILNAYIQNY